MKDEDVAPSLDPASSASPLFVVGVGASAGGLEALERFFDGIRPTGNLAFVVVQHLSPDFKSLMDELLSRHTSLTIHRAEHGMRVEADGLYLMPPRKEMRLSQGRLELRDREPEQGLSLPIDTFFASLAQDVGPRGIAIVLSGSGSDGSRGIRAVHEAGGLVLAQSEETAKFDGMPRSAAETGVVDLVLSPEELAAAVLRYATTGDRLDAGAEAGTQRGDALARILQLLRKETGVDFSGYKPSTVGRRIERRLVLSATQSLDDYLNRIEGDPEELRSLYRDLLIGVTRFFRDPEAFESLRRQVLPPAVEGLADGEELRVWVPACATGEEAFSIAILAHEAFRTRGKAPALRLFATDIHRASLDVASAGVYGPESVGDVPADLRERYFRRTGAKYQVSEELRSSIVFAHHNLLRDAPFTRLDLVSCRNFLIYLNPAPQQKVVSLLHFALKPTGALLLGPSESPGVLADEFVPVDVRWKIFRKRRDVRLPSDVPLPVALDLGGRVVRPRSAEEDARVKAARESLLQRFAPPTVLLDEALTVVHAFNGAARFFTPRDGPPSANLLDLLAGELKIVVGGALKRVQKERQPVEYAAVRVTSPAGPERVRVSVVPLGAEGRGDAGILLTLQPEAAPAEAPAPPSADVGALAHERAASLESELRHAKENLQATIEELETSNEELQATNEELIASNEELQSTNEELHSVNEELYTVNAEYQAKIAELTELTADMNHLLESTQVHTLFLDGSLRLRKFTPRMGELFNLLPQDVGRRIEGFAHDIDDDRLGADLAAVLETGEPVVREVADRKGAAFLLRILPYRPAKQIEGVVLTLVDIAALKQAQAELARSEERYRTLLRAIASVVWTADAQGRFAVPQQEWEEYTGQPWEQHRGAGWLEAVHPEDRASLADALRGAVAAGEPLEAQGRLWSARHVAHRRFTLRAVPVRDPAGGVREWVGNVVDVHDAWATDAALREKTAQLQGILDYSPAFLWVKDLAGRYLLASRSAEAILGQPPEAARGKTDHDLATAAVADALHETERRVARSGEMQEAEEELPYRGERRTFLSTKFALRDDAGRVVAVAGISTDVSDRRRASENDREAIRRRDQLLAMLSHELRTPLGAILNAAELVAAAGASPGRREAGLAIIRRQSRQMATLLDDLLDVARLTRDQLTLRSEPTDLGAVVRDAVDASRSAAEKKALELRVRAPREPVPVVGDPARLQQVVANLIGNATRYSDRGAIEVSLEVREGAARVHVRDQGIGMTGEELERVFELFYQAPQALDRSSGGLGVGLHLARQIARMHGGEVTARSAGRGAGSEFVLEIPVSASADPGPAPRRSGARARARIVLVEDNDDIRETLKEILDLAGHEVLVCNDGVNGVELIVGERPDFALVDLGLPGLDGIGVAQRVRERIGNHVRLVALTGYGSADDRARTREAGFHHHLLKPVDPESLLSLVAEEADGPGPLD